MPYTGLLSDVAVFPFQPNWKSPVPETLEWNTGIFKAFDGTEQRRSLRVIPRRGLEYDFLIKADDARLFESLVWARQNKLLAVPWWMNKATLTAPANIGDSVVHLDTTDLGFADGDLICLYRNTTTHELVAANVVSAAQITLKSALTKPWLQGERVYPVLVGKSPASIPTQRHTDTLITGRASFISSADQNDPFLPATAASVLYDGKEVLQWKPNWQSAIDNTWMHDFETLDAGVGAILWKPTETAGHMSRPYSFLLKTRAEIVAFRAFLGRMRGRAKTCWIPSWHDDFTIASTTLSGGSTLTVNGTAFATNVGVNTARDRLAIRLIDGNWLYRKITGVSIIGSTTQFQLDTPFTQDIGPTNTGKINLLLHCRMVGDKVEIPWRTDSVADPQLVFMTVPV